MPENNLFPPEGLRPQPVFSLQTLQQAQTASAAWIEESGTADTPEANALSARIGELFSRAEGTMN